MWLCNYGAMLRSIFNFLGIGLVVVLVGAGVLYGVQYWRERTSPEYQAISYFKDLEKQYAEDTYGGETPEETLRLFIDALKAGDTDLAAKYFLIEDQEQWREDLAKIKEKGLINQMIKELESAEWAKQETTAFLTLVDANNVVTEELVMHRIESNNRWKITEL
jgi:hypothetical protein